MADSSCGRPTGVGENPQGLCYTLTVKTNRLIVLLGAAAALLLAGCKREEGIRAYDAPKDPPPGNPPVMASTGDAAPTAPAGAIRWTAPAGWTEVEKAPM